MADISKGYTFTTNESLSASKLHGLVDDSRITSIVGGDLATGLRLVAKSAPASPSEGDCYPDSDFLLRFYDGSTFLYPPGLITMENHSGDDIPAYTPLTLDVTGNDWSISTSKMSPAGRFDHLMFGVAYEDISDGGSGLVVYKGLALVNVIPSATVDREPGDWVFGTNVTIQTAAPIGSRQNIDDESINDPTSCWAILMEDVTADASQTPVVKYCLVFK